MVHESKLKSSKSSKLNINIKPSKLDWWINFFNDLGDQGYFDTGMAYHADQLRFSFMRLLQLDLDKNWELWNKYPICKV